VQRDDVKLIRRRLLRHCEEPWRRNPVFYAAPGLLREARNDVERPAETPKFVIARSSCDEAIQLFLPCFLDRFAEPGIVEKTASQLFTTKPVAHGCGPVLGGTIDFEQNATIHRTGQSRLGLFIHRRQRAGRVDTAKPALRTV
jgi:hypothetical protein